MGREDRAVEVVDLRRVVEQDLAYVRVGDTRIIRQAPHFLHRVGDDRLEVRVVGAEHRVVGTDVETGQRLLVGVLPHELVHRDLAHVERRDPDVAIRRDVLAGQPAEGTLSLHEPRERHPVVTPTQRLIDVRDRRDQEEQLRLDERRSKVGEAIEHTAQDQLPQRPVGVEGVLDGERHDRGEPRRAVAGKSGSAVRADRQVDVLDGSPDGVEHRVEEVGAAGVERGHHDPAEAVLLRPVDVLDRLLDVVEGHDGLARAAPGRLGAEVGEPTVVRPTSNGCQFRISRAAEVFEPVHLERLPVGEQHLRHDPLAFERFQPAIGVPLRLEPVLGIKDAGVGQPRVLRRLDRLVVVVEVLLFDVAAIAGARRLDMAVD